MPRTALLLLLLAIPCPAMTSTLDVVYAEREGVDPKLLSLDIYAPSAEGKHPVVVMIHGGGWRAGDKANRSMTEHKAPHFTGAGYVYVSINYRLSKAPKTRHPAHVEDVAAALAFVHDNVAEYGGDPGRIFVMGHSAGAHLAALVAADRRRLAAHGKPLSIVKGVVCLDAGAYDLASRAEDAGPRLRAMYEAAFGDALRDASPLHHVAEGVPPMLLFYTGNRKPAEMVAALRRAGAPAEAIHAKDKDHAGINACIGQEGDPYTARILRFLANPRRTVVQSGRALTVGGRERTYVVQAPGSSRGKLPVVMLFHGGGGNAGRYTDGSFRPLVAEGKLIAVYPQAWEKNWNDGRGAPRLASHREGVDDVAFVRAIVKDIEGRFPVDRSRVFATGVSNGAIFSHRLAAEASDLFLAVAPLIGGLAEPLAPTFAPEHPVSLLVIQGDADRLVPIDGGPVARGGRGRIIATDAAVKKYLARNGIEGEPEVSLFPDLAPDDGTTTVVRRYPRGEGGTRVEVWIVEGGGHTVPGSEPPLRVLGKASRDFDAWKVVWKFFAGCPARP